MQYKCMDNNSTEEIEQSPSAKKLPFNNLFLNAGVVEGENKFWMYIACISTFVFGYGLVGYLAGEILRKRAFSLGISSTEFLNNPALILDPEKIQLDKNIILVIEFTLFVMAFLGFLAGLRYFHQKRLLSILTGYEKFRFKNFFFAFAIWAIMVVMFVLVSYFTSSTNDLVLQFDPAKFAVLFVICIIFLPIQTLTEEVIFRGYLLQGFSQVFRNGLFPLILTSIMFGLAHMSNPETGAYGVGIMLTYYTMFGLFLGAITLLSEGLELAFGIHLANNLVTALSVTSQSAVLKTDSIFYAKTEDPGAELVLAFCSIVVVFVVFWFKFRWKNFSLLIK